MQVPLTIEAIGSSDGMAALLAKHLIEHDSRQPRMKGELVPLSTSLPLEIVARIVRSPCLLELERASIGMRRGIRDSKYDDPITVQHSLDVYDKIWGAKKCTVFMLQKMKRDMAVVTGRERDYIAGWVVQLSYDTSRFETDPRKVEFADIDKMRDELARLIDIAISQRL